jgi:hypothetical protein
VSDHDPAAELKQLAHDVRNALNGVAVNLEVARSRAQRGAEVAQVAPFLETAVQQLESATRLHKHYTDIVAALAATTTPAAGAPVAAVRHDVAPARPAPAHPAPDDTHSHL